MHVNFVQFVNQRCEMSLHDLVCLVVMGVVRETIVRIYFYDNIPCTGTRDVTHTWIIAVLELSSNIGVDYQKKKMSILHGKVLSFEL